MECSANLRGPSKESWGEWVGPRAPTRPHSLSPKKLPSSPLQLLPCKKKPDFVAGSFVFQRRCDTPLSQRLKLNYSKPNPDNSTAGLGMGTCQILANRVWSKSAKGLQYMGCKRKTFISAPRENGVRSLTFIVWLLCTKHYSKSFLKNLIHLIYIKFLR